jgi:hypothetical protein
MPRTTLKIAAALSLAVGGVAFAQEAQPGLPALPPQENQLDRPAEEVFIGADRPEQQNGEAGKLAEVATFVSPDTLAVSRLDLQRLDVQAASQWLQELARSVETDPQRQQRAIAQIETQFGIAQWWIQSMREAGAQTVYSVISMQEGRPPASAVIVPIGEGNNAEKIRALLTIRRTFMPLETEIIRDAVVLAPQEVLATFRQPQAGEPEGLNTALESVSGSAVQLAFTPSPEMKQWARDMARQGQDALPADVQPGEIQALPERVEWAALGIDSPPEQSMKFIMNAVDEQAAGQIRDTLVKLLDSARQNPRIAAQVEDIQRLTEALKPEVDGQKVIIALDKQELDQIVREDLAQALRRARAEQMPAEAELEEVPAEHLEQENRILLPREDDDRIMEEDQFQQD